MGSGPSKQVLEDAARAIRIGDLAGVCQFLQQVSAARAQARSEAPPADKLSRELADLNLDGLILDGHTPLQLAASCGRAEVLRCILDTCGADPHLPDLDLNVLSNRKWTALHFAAASANPQTCPQCVADLLRHKADPCIADDCGHTPLDVARKSNCPLSVRALEENVQIWQGWADHDEHMLLQLPNWRQRWLVVCQDRYPNTGSQRLAGSISISCYNCRTVLKAPMYCLRVQCSCCKAEVVVTATLQLALYTPVDAANSMLPAMPSLRLDLPTSRNQLGVKILEEASIKSIAGALMEGKIRRALQNTSGSAERTHGLTVKLFASNLAFACEHSLRVSTPADRDSLLRILQDPARASFDATCAQQSRRGAAAALPPVTGVCSAERGPAATGSLPSHSIPEPSAPPLNSGELPPVSNQALALPATQATTTALTLPDAQATTMVPVQPAAKASSGNEATAEDDSGMCVVCWEKAADTAVVPCGHMCGCLQCLQAMQGIEGAQCPMCRGPLTSVIRIFRG